MKTRSTQLFRGVPAGGSQDVVIVAPATTPPVTTSTNTTADLNTSDPDPEYTSNYPDDPIIPPLEDDQVTLDPPASGGSKALDVPYAGVPPNLRTASINPWLVAAIIGAGLYILIRKR